MKKKTFTSDKIKKLQNNIKNIQNKNHFYNIMKYVHQDGIKFYHDNDGIHFNFNDLSIDALNKINLYVSKIKKKTKKDKKFITNNEDSIPYYKDEFEEYNSQGIKFNKNEKKYIKYHQYHDDTNNSDSEYNYCEFDSMHDTEESDNNL